MGDSSSSSTNSKENYADLCESVKELKQLLADFIRAQQPATPPATPPAGSEVQHANFPADNTAPQSRFTKLDFPQYAGKEDPLIWLHRCELYFHTTHTPDREKVGLAAFNMTGEAQLWYYQILRDEPPLSWLLFKEYCKLRFGPPRSNNPLGELANLKQRGRHIDEYVEDFQTLLARATSVRFEQQVDLFTAGLDELLRIDVERSKPASLAEAVNTARDFARKFQLLGLAVARQSPRPVSSLPSSPVITVTKPRAPPKPSFKPPPLRRLSPAEQEERKAKGLCFNCDETWFRGHRCKHLFCILNVCDEDDPLDAEEEAPDVAEISLNAIAGVSTGKMMKLKIVIADQPLLALIDTGSTHNFINATTVKSLDLATSPRPGMRVAVANGEHLPSSGICKQVLVHHNSDCFMADFYVLPLAGFDVVLGVKWLSTLGPIWWDFHTLTMRFSLNGKLVSWLGEHYTRLLLYLQPVSVTTELFLFRGQIL
nr:uncharacterized protein LOC109160849 [Ipomoea batatas]